MKNRFKKILSFIVAITVILSTVTCISMITATADDVYITKTVVDDIYNNGYTIAKSFTSYADASQLYKINYGTVVGTNKSCMFPYTSANVVDYKMSVIWFSDKVDMTRFIMYTYNSTSDQASVVESLYSFYTSPDGTNWTAAPFTVGEGTKEYGSCNSYKVTIDNLPAGTKYFKFVPLINGANANRGWCTGFLKAEYEYKELLEKPLITAEYKNLYGVYANELNDGAKITRDAKISVSNIGEYTGGSLTVTKDGSTLNAEDLYNSDEAAYLFTENGEYTVKAENLAGETTLSFTLKKVTEDTVVTKTTIDDIYNTGKTTAIEKTNYSNATTLVNINITQSTNDWLMPVGKYYLFPYVNGITEPEASVVWYSDIGFGSFWVDTFNTASRKPDFIEKNYSFYYSTDGTNWTETEFTVGEKTTEYTGAGAISYRVTVDKIPDSARYIKFLSCTVTENQNECWESGFLRAGYTTYVLLPEINANFEDTLGGFANPVGDGAVVPSKVKVDFVDVGEEIGGNITVKKDGSEIPLPSDSILTDDGEYEIIATNVKGTTKLSFTIDSSKAKADSETYVFSEGKEDAQEDFDKLLSITPDGAGKDFTKGDGHVIVNDTGILKYSDNLAWWGCTEGGTKLAIGSDTKGYQKDGYFYFVNKGSDGKKYTGFSITYTLAVQSGYPRDAYFSVYTADKYNGTYRLVEPSSVTMDDYTGAPAAAVFHATYYLGSEASVVKIEFHPQAPAAELWKGGFLSILNLTKLSLPLVEATSGNTKLVDNQITQKDVKINVSNELYYFVEKDSKQIELPANKTLTEDGFYTVTAANYAGTSKVSFYIAKQNPAIQLIDSSGNFLPDNSVVVDDVKVIFYNADKAETLHNGVLYSDKKELNIDLNGTYTFTAENDYGVFERTLIFNRPLPTLKAYNFQSKQVAEGETIVTQATYSLETADSYIITLNGKAYKPKEEFKLTEEGTYFIEAVNKAGKTSLSFTIKYNPPLPEVKHQGDTVVKYNYQEKGRTSWQQSVYKYDNVTLDASSALRSDWTGFTGGVLHSNDRLIEAFITYKSVGFKSFHLYTAIYPCKTVAGEDMFKLYASSNGKDFNELECTVEEDISYITTGYKKYRYVAKNIPENVKYIKVLVNEKDAEAAWSRCITDVEFSYNKKDVGKLDVNDILFMIEDCFDGETVTTDIYNGDTVIPKKVFAAFQDNDKTLKVNLLNKKGEATYSLSFNGLTVTEPMDFNIGVKEGTSKGQSVLKALDDKASALLFNQKGEWTVGVTVGIALGNRQAGTNYALYMYKDGVFSLVDSVMADTKGFLYYTLPEYSDFIVSAKTDLIKEEENNSFIEDEADNEDDEDETPIIMVVNRRKFVPNNSAQNNYLWIIIVACAAVLVIATAAAVLIILVKKGKINLKGRKL